MILMMEVFFSYFLVFMLCMSICSVLRDILDLIRYYIKTEEFNISDTRVAMLWCAVSYIITFIVFA